MTANKIHDDSRGKAIAGKHMDLDALAKRPHKTSVARQGRTSEGCQNKTKTGVLMLSAARIARILCLSMLFITRAFLTVLFIYLTILMGEKTPTSYKYVVIYK